MRFLAGLGQVKAVSGDVGANLSTHLEAIESAREAGVELLLLPELSLTGVDLQGHMPRVALRCDSAPVRAVAEAARELDIVFGFVEDAGNGRYHNSLAYISRGELQHVHRKIYLVSADPVNERRFFTEGDSLRAVPSRFGRLALLNCEDCWHVGPAYLAMLQGATLLLTCAATPEGPPEQLPSAELWLNINRTYAILFEVFNLFVNRVGREGEMDFVGSSHAVDPRGEVIAQAAAGAAGLTTVSVDTELVARQRYEVSYVRDERLSFTVQALRQLIVSRPLGDSPGGDLNDEDSGTGSSAARAFASERDQ